MILMTGKEVAENLKITEENKKLVLLLIGDNPSAITYANSIKKKAANFQNICVEIVQFSEETFTQEVIDYIESISNEVDAILPILPFPLHISEIRITEAIPSKLDIDCLGSRKLGLFYLGFGKGGATPTSVIELLGHYKIPLSGKHAVVLGRSRAIGRQVAEYLLSHNATVTICHSKTENLEEILKTGDIIVSAMGKPHFVKPNMVKDGVVIVDVGTTWEDGKLKGDVDPEVMNKASAFTPVPGGVGVVSGKMLLSML